MQMKLMGITNVDFCVIDQRPIKFSIYLADTGEKVEV
jgi:hypothetical protein